MFEIPVNVNSKTLSNERKLRYRYINQFTRRFERKDDRNGMITPETSEDELQQRKKRDWLHVIGEYGSDDDERSGGQQDDEEEEEEVIDEDYNLNNEERKFFKKIDKPQETYEHWPSHRKKTRIQRDILTYHRYNKVSRYVERKMANSLVHVSSKNRYHFKCKIDGMEIVEPLHKGATNFQLKQIETLTNLLYLNVNRGNWEIAYKIFAMLIRIPKVDIRSVWNVGNRILYEKDKLRSLEFLEWMSSVYSTRVTFIQGINYRFDPVFRSGSKNHTPKYTLQWLWNSLLEYTEQLFENDDENIDKLIDKIAEMVLIPPFMDDPEIWFIYSMCHMVKADFLSSKFDTHSVGSMRDISMNQVIQHINDVKRYLNVCKEKSQGQYESNEMIITKQLKAFEVRLYKEPVFPLEPENDLDGDNEEEVDESNVFEDSANYFEFDDTQEQLNDLDTQQYFHDTDDSSSS
ncbi:hypothetical protein KAFR_0L00420 [Kazachstania africana CBS 2517]|uniref:RNA polymerase I-specific transcription initiation factor RRN11 n=1 Tax=Kazachstania africana (strain ATCC 22294 / BCRC 22015 / CBS 2517 / CECT 1963 / NBRC 1671 / NRRL Y-8276) TaxID=1071382 RepID=H2B1Z9_KAZAF|nr:hypothetical protein KAFR_0L00420 [Kazachstania africana CBS 2517]CCF60649.1 hypothetical protein KAFR_0L00420 [Kazachstania africana CBS 2517]